jgi:hypothetical protein
MYERRALKPPAILLLALILSLFAMGQALAFSPSGVFANGETPQERIGGALRAQIGSQIFYFAQKGDFIEINLHITFRSRGHFF